MDQGTVRGGWRISEVERLLGLGRRDIQRACYGGRGGVAILDPTDTAWGRRTYDGHDLAQLFLVGQLRRRGLSLPEVKAEFEGSRAAGRTVEDMLAVQVARLREQAEEVAGRLLQAEALLAAPGLVDGPGMALAVDLWLGPGSSEAVRKAAEAAATREETIGESDEKKR